MLCRIAAEVCDIGDHPAQGQNLIHEAVVARSVMRRLARKLRMGKEAEDAQPVVDCNQQHSVIYQRSVIEERGRCGPALISAAVNPEHHRQQLLRRPYRRNDIQIEAILLAGFAKLQFQSPSASAHCAHGAPKAVASRTPLHGLAGKGSRQRRSPTGGCA